MIAKFMNMWIKFGFVVSIKYCELPKYWMKVVLYPVYLVFVIPWTLGLLLGAFMYMVQCKFKGYLTFKESFGAFKQGVVESLQELKG